MHHADRFAEPGIGRIGISHGILIGLVVLVDLFLLLLELSLDVLDTGADLVFAERTKRRIIKVRRRGEGEARGCVLTILVVLDGHLLKLCIGLGPSLGVNAVALASEEVSGEHRAGLLHRHGARIGFGGGYRRAPIPGLFVPQTLLCRLVILVDILLLLLDLNLDVLDARFDLDLVDPGNSNGPAQCLCEAGLDKRVACGGPECRVRGECKGRIGAFGYWYCPAKRSDRDRPWPRPWILASMPVPPASNVPPSFCSTSR